MTVPNATQLNFTALV